MRYTYACRDYPGMEGCPAEFTTDAEDELWRHLELHGAAAHGEDPAVWSEQERQQLRELIRRTEGPSRR